MQELACLPDGPGVVSYFPLEADVEKLTGALRLTQLKLGTRKGPG